MTVSLKYSDASPRFQLKALSILSLLVVIWMLPTTVSASSLTDLFNTEAFHGSWEVFTKMNFIGQIMQYAISAFSLIGLFTVVMRIMLTMLFLSSKNLWNNVHDLKSKGKGAKFFGMGKVSAEVFNANYGVGLDAFVSFALSLFPDIKSYSDYSEDNVAGNNYEESDTITMYLLKSALTTILTIFAFTIGFNGVLWKAYGNVVDGMGVAAEAFVNTRLDTIVDRALNTGSNPTFGYSADGTEYGAFKQSVAKSIYNKVISKTTDLSSEVKLTIGANVDNWIASNLDYMAYSALGVMDEGLQQAVDLVLNPEKSTDPTSLSGSNLSKFNEIEITDAKAKNLEYSVIINKTSSYENAKTIDAGSLGLSGDSGWFIHVFVSKKANSNETNYFEYDADSSTSKKGKTGASGGTDGPTTQKFVN